MIPRPESRETREERVVSAGACGIDHEVGRVPLPNQPQEPEPTPSSSTAACTGRGGRGCPCAFHERRRPYARRYAAKKRARAISAKRMTARTCPRRFGRHGVCGGVLDADVIGGVLVVTCPLCERMAKGLCRDCPATVDGPVGRARRCAVHRAAANRQSMRKYTENHRYALRVRARKSYQTSEAERTRRAEYKRAWRKANRDKVKAQKRRAALRQPARVREYMTEYRATHRRKSAAQGRARYHGTLPLRTCLTARCSTVLTGRKKKCARCKEREARAAAQALAARRRAA